MGLFKSSKAPTPQDPRATAAAQQQMNKQTAIAQAQLNQVDEFTPYGSSVYTPTGQVTPAGIQRYRRDTTLDPAQARILQQQNKVNEELNRVAAKQVGRVGKTLSKPFNFRKMAPGGSASGVSKTVNNLRDMTNNPYDLQAGKPLAPTAQGIADAADRAAMSVDSPFDYSSAPARPEADAAARQQVIDSVYGQFQSRLDPRFEAEQIAMETKLANSGIPRGSAAFSTAMDDFNRGRNDAYQSAQNAAIQAGGAEQSRLFGIGAQARGDAIAEDNYLRGLPTSEQARIQAMRGQQFDAQAQERDRAIAEELQQRQIPMQEQKNLAAMQTGLFGLRDTERGRQIQEASYLRNLPLNETSALMSGTQIQNPTFTATPQTGIASTDYTGLVSNNYTNQMNAYQAQMQRDNAMIGALGSVASAGAYGWAASDIRVKNNISVVGRLDNGLPVYSFQYITGGPQQIGLMAQDVEKVNPSAVMEINGIKHVNYSEAVQ
jgi:hypothetical protein